MKRNLLLLLLLTVFSACDFFKEKPEAGIVLAEYYKNKAFNKFDTLVYNQIFQEKYDSLQGQFQNPKVLKAFYESELNKASIFIRSLKSGELEEILSYFNRSREDGFNPDAFQTSEIDQLKAKLDVLQKTKDLKPVYPIIAELELKLASNMLKYHSFLKFGSIQPRKVLNRYYIPNLRPDSTYLDSLLRVDNITSNFLTAQTSDPEYLALKDLYQKYKDSPLSEGSIKQLILINMERARWKMPKTSAEIVRVNIPDYTLTWTKGQDTIARMKVCVGARRQADFESQIKVYLKSKKLDDKPKNHETPQLFSEFNAIQVNPIWNIPVSIAQSEIYYQAIKDPYYLSNNNMRVYYKGKLVSDPDTIQWSKYKRENLPFQFKQGSGEGNALGKFKFIFDNGSSIYLHDTNNKTAFSYKMRAISHGCVRVEDPLKFASLLVKNQAQYDDLRMEVNLPPVDSTKTAKYQKILAKKADTMNRYQLKPSWYPTRKNILIITDYKTGWVKNGILETRADVYDYDPIVWNSLKRYILP